MVIVMLLLYLFSFFLIWVDMNLYLRNQMLIKYDQLKLYLSKPVSLSLLLAFMLYNSQHFLSTNHKCTTFGIHVILFPTLAEYQP
jgi:hypothetical protein